MTTHARAHNQHGWRKTSTAHAAAASLVRADAHATTLLPAPVCRQCGGEARHANGAPILGALRCPACGPGQKVGATTRNQATVKERVLAALTHGERTKAEVAKALGEQTERVEAALTDLHRAGSVRRRKAGRKHLWQAIQTRPSLRRTGSP
jgi:predicted Zn-ribbon and HTH transcriptional regulator